MQFVVSGTTKSVKFLVINLELNYEAYSEPYQASKIGCFAKIVNGLQPLPIFAKRSILDDWQGSEYHSEFFNLFELILQSR